MKILLLALCVHEGGIAQYLQMFVTACTARGHDIETMSFCTWVPKHRSRFRARVAFTKAAYERRNDFDLVIAGHPFLSPIAGAMRRPYIAFTFGIDIWDRLPWPQQLALQHADQVVAPSNDTAGRVHVIQGVPASHITVIRPAVDPQLLEAGTAAVGAPRHIPFTLLTVARMDSRERYKGHDQVLAALPEIRRRLGFESVRYLIVGGGDDEPRLRDLAEAHAPGLVRFHGQVEPDMLADLYADADLFVLPSTKDGFAISLIEAAAFGKATIGGGGGCLEALQECVTGYSTHNDPDYPLAERIIELAQDDQKRIQMGRAGRRFVEDGFTQARFTQDVETLLATLSGSS